MVFNKSNSIKSFSVALLLGAYVFTIFYNSLHPFFSHAHQAHETCSVEAENDPCHKKIYHHDNHSGCEHDAHVHNPKHVCEFCDALVNIHVFPEEKVLKEQDLLVQRKSTDTINNSLIRFYYLIPPPRGPPSLV